MGPPFLSGGEYCPTKAQKTSGTNCFNGAALFIGRRDKESFHPEVVRFLRELQWGRPFYGAEREILLCVDSQLVYNQVLRWGRPFYGAERYRHFIASVRKRFLKRLVDCIQVDRLVASMGPPFLRGGE